MLRDAGVAAINYVEQLSFILFLKMCDEKQKNALIPMQIFPPKLKISWDYLVSLSGDDLESEYQRILRSLGT